MRNMIKCDNTFKIYVFQKYFVIILNNYMNTKILIVERTDREKGRKRENFEFLVLTEEV